MSLTFYLDITENCHLEEGSKPPKLQHAILKNKNILNMNKTVVVPLTSKFQF